MLPLSKSVLPDELASIGKASTPEGAAFVDHVPHMSNHPPEIQPGVDTYRNQVLNSPGKVKKEKIGRDSGGITKKVIYKVKGSPQTGFFDNSPESDQRFMVKPYHERVIKRISKWQRFPIQGWAEMANQNLYHAAGIGHLHQKVHVDEHDMPGGKQPALVIHMDRGYSDISPMYDHKLEGNPLAEDEKGQGAHFKAKQIAMMDFLTNNLDRHAGNLMKHGTGELHPDTEPSNEHPNRVPKQKVDNLLAVDHSRSFQYISPRDEHMKWSAPTKRPRELNDNFGDYHNESSLQYASPFIVPNRLNETKNFYDRQMKTLRSYAPAFDWWGEQSPKIRAEMGKQLEQIKDPETKAHIQRNFDARADWLDERAKLGLENYGTDWYEDPVKMFRPGEKSDDELRQESDRHAREEYERTGKIG